MRQDRDIRKAEGSGAAPASFDASVAKKNSDERRPKRVIPEDLLPYLDLMFPQEE